MKKMIIVLFLFHLVSCMQINETSQECAWDEDQHSEPEEIVLRFKRQAKLSSNTLMKLEYDPTAQSAYLDYYVSPYQQWVGNLVTRASRHPFNLNHLSQISELSPYGFIKHNNFIAFLLFGKKKYKNDSFFITGYKLDCSYHQSWPASIIISPHDILVAARAHIDAQHRLFVEAILKEREKKTYYKERISTDIILDGDPERT